MKRRSGFSLIEIVVGTTMLSVAVLAALVYIQTKRTGVLNLMRMGEMEDLRRFLRQNIDCEKTLTNESATCSTGGQYIHGYMPSSDPIITNPANGQVFGNYTVKIACNNDAQASNLTAEYKDNRSPAGSWKNLFTIPRVCAKQPVPLCMPAVAAGRWHSCAISDGAAFCWGDSDDGELGNNNKSTGGSAIPVLADGMSEKVTSIAGGGDHTCAVMDGAAYCWGANGNYQLGNGTNLESSTPVKVQGLTIGVTAIAAGTIHSCAVVDQIAKCWGNNGSYRLGNNSNTLEKTPFSVLTSVTPLVSLSGVTAIATGNTHSCAIANGDLWCWGDNANYRLGDNSTTDSRMAKKIITGGVTAVAAGFSHTCAVVNGAAKCWGNNNQGQVGDGTEDTDRRVPTSVTNMSTGVTAIATMTEASCAIQNGAVYCWGSNTSGKLGNGSSSTVTKSLTPVLAIASGAVALATGGQSHMCAVVTDGTRANTKVRCWGEVDFGRLGNAVYTTDQNSPVTVTLECGKMPQTCKLDALVSDADLDSIAASSATSPRYFDKNNAPPTVRINNPFNWGSVQRRAAAYTASEAPATRSSIHYDTPSRQRLCEQLGYTAVKSASCSQPYGYGSGCGFSSPSDNYMGWYRLQGDGTYKWQTRSATAGNTWVGTMTCEKPKCK